MFTLKVLLKTLLYGKIPKKEEKPDEKTTRDNQSHSITLNQNQDETETDEIPRNSELDNTDTRKDTRFDQELREAYRRGVIDGRNSKIEERYFPAADDGIPSFHGYSSKELSTGDIFSMAREA